METTTELNSYFDRVGYKGTVEANLDVLKKLHLLLPKAIPFENLNPFLGIPVKLDLKSLQQKLIHNNYPLDKAADVHREVETGHGCGKVVLKIS